MTHKQSFTEGGAGHNSPAAWAEPTNIFQVVQEEHAEWAMKGGLPCPRKGSGEIDLPKIRTFQQKRQLASSEGENSTPPAQGRAPEGGAQ